MFMIDYHQISTYFTGTFIFRKLRYLRDILHSNIFGIFHSTEDGCLFLKGSFQCMGSKHMELLRSYSMLVLLVALVCRDVVYVLEQILAQICAQGSESILSQQITVIIVIIQLIVRSCHFQLVSCVDTITYYMYNHSYP